MRFALIGAAVGLALYVMALLFLFLTQRRILFHPDNTRPDLTRTGVPGLEAIRVATGDGLTLLAWYCPPDGPDAPLVLYLHGNAGNIGHRAWRLGALRAQGWGVLLPEYRGYGGNPGRPSEEGLLTDARAALTTARTMGFPPERILLWGESLGTGLAVRLAAEHAVAALLLEAPYTSIAAIARLRFPFAPVRWLLRDRFESLAHVGRVRAPVLIMHGALDRIVPVAMGRAMFAAAPEPKALWIAPDTGHIKLVEAGATEAAADFVRRYGRGGNASSETAAPNQA